MRLQGNRFEYLYVGRGMRDQLSKFATAASDVITGVLSEAIVSGNSFGQSGSIFVSQILTLSGCAFTGPLAGPPITATFASATASVSGNVSEVFGDQYQLRVYSKNYDPARPYDTRAANAIFVFPR